MYDILIRGGKVVDGSGRPAFKGDIGINGDKISCISDNINDDADKILNAYELIVTPGFIDPHTHSDMTAFLHPKAVNSLFQGITTEIVGNCGQSPAPLNENNRSFLKKRIAFQGQVDLNQVKCNWNSMSEFLKELSKISIGVNIVPLIGHCTLRSYIMGVEGRGGEREKPSVEEMKEMKETLEVSLLDGAFGLSSGLIYPTGRNASTKELIELNKIVTKHHGVYSSHLRNGSNPLNGFKEFLAIVKKSGVRGIASHLRGRLISYPHQLTGPKSNQYLQMIDESVNAGLDIYLDVIPIPSGSNSLHSILFGTSGLIDEIFDDEGRLLNINDFLLKISNKETRKSLIERLRYAVNNNTLRINPKIDHRLIHFSKTHPEFFGQTLTTISKIIGLDVIDTILLSMKDDEGETRYGNWAYEEDIKQLLLHKLSMPSSDGWWLPTNVEKATLGATPGPRMFGSFPFFIQNYVRLRQSIPLETAIAKMTSLPAKVFNIRDRGIIKENMFADLTLFNFKKIRNLATFNKPSAFPQGINYVLVNGKIALKNGKIVASSGRILRRTS